MPLLRMPHRIVGQWALERMRALLLFSTDQPPGGGTRTGIDSARNGGYKAAGT